MEDGGQAVLIGTGALPFLILVSAVLTLPVAWLLLALYRRAVLRSMARPSGVAAVARAAGAPSGDSHALAHGRPLTPLRLEYLAPATGAATAPPAGMRRSLWALGSVHGVAGLVYALTLSGAWMHFAWAEGGFVLARFLWLLSCYAWPTVLSLGLVLAVTPAQRLAVGMAYFAMVLAFAAWALARNPTLTALDVAAFWLITNLPATLLLLAFMHRRIRAVGPLVLAFMVAAVTGAQVAVALAGSSEAALAATVRVGGLLGLGGTATFYALLLAGAAVAALLGWAGLRWLGRRHLARRASDQTLTLEAMWLLFAVVQTVSFAFEGVAWMLSGVVAFAAWKGVSQAGFRIAGLGRASGPAPSLLLLRVFALGAHSERLFDALGKRWLRIGNIDLIAGPDLATSAVEPHEFLDFVGGRLSRQFVRDEDDLARRLQARALGPDPDGRHRVNEFFCHDDTWKPTMLALARSADAILMDLRSFSPQHQGCRYELQQLLDFVPAAKLVLLVDARTDRRFMEATLETLWRQARTDSPNRRTGALRLQVIEDAGSRTLPALLGALVRAAG